MITPHTLSDLDKAYLALRDTLVGLSHHLLHSVDEAEITGAFGTCEELATKLFGDEEAAMAVSECPALEINQRGHRKFLQTLDNLRHEYRASRSGIPLANRSRIELTVWLHEHHRVVDGQLANHLRRRTLPALADPVG
jgi:hemerythrin